MKKIFSFLLMFGLLLSISSFTAFASDLSTYDQLTDEEKTYLSKAKFSQESINESSVEFIRELISEGAVLVKREESIHNFVNESTKKDKKDKKDEFTQNATIEQSQLKLVFSAYKVTSDRPGSPKFRLYGTYDWLKVPFNAYIDAISLGWSSPDITFPVTSNGDAAGYYNNNYETYQSRFLRSYTYVPTSYATSGLGNTFDIRQGANRYDGNVNIYVYSSKTSGAFNAFLTYGHAKSTLNPTFTTSKGFFSVSPGTTVDTAQKAAEVLY